jgi:hypothetical protein
LLPQPLLIRRKNLRRRKKRKKLLNPNLKKKVD